jgi:tetratricopeptide (TPR) repeat protein
VEDAQKLLVTAQQIKSAVPDDANKPAAETVAAKTPIPVQVAPVKSAAPTTESKKRSPASAAIKKILPSSAKQPRRPQQKAVVLQNKLVSSRPADAATKNVGGTSIKVDTNARGALLYAARSAEQSGDWRGALASYRAALDIDPENYRIMSNSAAAYNKLGMFPDGEREARRALVRKPDFVPALINAAIACSSQGNNRDTLKFFTAATAAEPGNRSLAINLGIMQERTGNLDEALATYRRTAASGDPQALLGMGRIQEQKGNKTEAIAAYKAIMSQKEVNPSLKREIKERLLRLEE